MKNIFNLFIILSLILLVAGCEDTSNSYTVELDKSSHYICGNRLYISDFIEGDTLNIENLFDDIEEICNIQSMENAKEEIEYLLDDDGSYSRAEILARLQKIYYNYFDR